MKGRFSTNSIIRLLIIFIIAFALAASAKRVKPRAIATTDGEVDDRSTMVRFLMYSCDFDVVGIVQQNSRYQRSGHSGEKWVEKQIAAYGQVLPQLKKHNPDYPTVEYLLSVLKVGNEKDSYNTVPPKMGNKGTPGEQLIIETLMDDDPREVHISCWGGSSTTGLALHTIKNSGKYTPEQIQKALAKVRIYCIWYQDASGRWIDTNVKEAFIFEAYRWENVWDYQSCDGCFKGRKSSNPKDVQAYMVSSWLSTNVKKDHGPLTTLIPQSWTSEGDTPSWLHLVNNGLESYTDYTIGGWGGRGIFDDKANKPNHITDGKLTEDGNGNKHYWRWVIAAQNDFAARADWCVKEFDQANHAPVAKFNGSTKEDFPIIKMEAMPGQTVNLDATGSTDPDNNTLSYKWWVYKEIGTYGKDVAITNATSQKATMTIPSDALDKTIHVILEVADNGEPSLIGYRRAIISVKAVTPVVDKATFKSNKESISIRTTTAYGLTTISLPQQFKSASQIMLFDMSGRAIPFTMASTSAAPAISYQSKGIAFLKLGTNKNSSVFKIIQ